MCMQLFRFPLEYIYKASEVKYFAKKVLRKFWYWNHEKVKKVSELGQKTFL